MPKSLTVSASDANRSFSKLLRRAQQGQTITITSHGRPVAELRPAETDSSEERERRELAWKAMEKSWGDQEPRMIGPWTREDLYERD